MCKSSCRVNINKFGRERPKLCHGDICLQGYYSLSFCCCVIEMNAILSVHNNVKGSFHWRLIIIWSKEIFSTKLISTYKQKFKTITSWKVSVLGVFLVRIFPYSVRMREYKDKKNSECGRFSRNKFIHFKLMFPFCTPKDVFFFFDSAKK